jgi:hypothetical protein
MENLTLGRFEEYRGHFIRVEGRSGKYYVPKKSQEELFFGEVIENMAFEEHVAAGWQVVALDVCIEDDEPVQTDGLLAVNPATNEVLVCDEGTNTKLKQPLSKLQIEICSGDEDEE